MPKVITYHDVDQKSATVETRLSNQEALIRALDLLDFYRVLTSQNDDSVLFDDNQDWIELKPLPCD